MNDDGYGDGPKRKGRGFPPDEYKFKPGQSGNPRGRPPGSKNKARAEAVAADLTPGDLVTIAEARRVVSDRNGISLPTINAIHRSRNTMAIKGSRLAAKEADARLLKAEEKVQRAKEQNFEMALLLQERAEAMLAEATKRGMKDPAIYPHPDDIHLDYATGEVSIQGPLTQTEARHWHELLREIDWVRKRVLHYRKEVARDPLLERPQYMLLRFTNAFFDLQATLPERYKRRPLPCWTIGADLPWPVRWQEHFAQA